MPGKGQFRYSMDECREFAAKYRELGSAIKAAEACGVEPYFIREAVNRIGHNPREYAAIGAAAKRQIPESENASIAEEFRSGGTYRSIAEKRGVSKNAVRECLDRMGVRVRRRGPLRKATDEQKMEIRKMFDGGASVTTIRDVMGLATGTVRKVLHESGVSHIPRRPIVARTINQEGYCRVIVKADDPMRCMSNNPTGYVLEHRLVMARHLGRPLLDTETVHHVDGNKKHNAIGNLQLRHGKHGTGVCLRCRACGSNDIETKEL